MHPYVQSSAIQIAKTWEQLNIHHQRNEERRCDPHTQWLLLHHWKEWNTAICSNTCGLTCWSHSSSPRWSHPVKSVRKRTTNAVWYHFMWNLKYGTKERVYKQKQIHGHRDPTSSCQGGRAGGRGMDWEFGIGRCKWLHLEWINNKVLMISTGNYITDPVINHNGKEYKKECVFVYTWAVQQRLANIINQLCFNKGVLKKYFTRGKEHTSQFL